MNGNLKKIIFYLLWFSVGSLFLPYADARPIRPESLYLYVGVQYDHHLSNKLKGKLLKFEGTYRRYTGLKHNHLTGVIRFTPRRKGVGTLNVKDSSGRIIRKILLTVRTTHLREIANEIQSLLKTVDGIQIRIVNNKVTVDGEILVPRDMRRIHDVVKAYPNQANSFVTLSPLAQQKMAKFIEKEINNPNVTVRVINTTFILEGFVNSESDKSRAEKIAILYVPDHISDSAVAENKVQEIKRKPVVNHIRVRPPQKDGRSKLIQMIVHYVELNKNYANSFRFQWMPRINDGTKFTFHSGAGTVGGIISGTIDNFLPKLNWAKSFGFARVLQSVNVTTESGKSATVNSTEDVMYYSTAGKSGEQTLNRIPVGLKLSLTPNIVGPRRNNVQMQINFSIGSAVGSTGATSKRDIQTNIYVESGLSAIIGGLITNKTFSDYNRAPQEGGGGGKSYPLLTFLSSKNFTRSQSQFVVFVTPIIKISASSGVSQIKKKFKLSSR